MSRVGKQPIPIPSGVTVDLKKNNISVKGPKGNLDRELHPEISVELIEDVIQVNRSSDSRRHRALHGLSRALIANMVAGVTEGFRKSLEIVGVGYKVELKGSSLLFTLGFSHPVLLHAPQGITLEVEKPTLFHVSGIDRELVGQVAATARSLKPPDPYKGKGVRYVNEYVRRKAGKTSK
ncbi:50S ribosomal protein L6 [candidate division LCP-89 bacterium B3_LCP]|uniref:Large ribosomal subunit protein uL6 n=1 Tax=candidate division LCP-89 bacterium B3_LCP TaxID=2012998 RepID=A0A532UZM9_UNCL8|nr:MAG: 50S ribosomal protein L6 [candidate division LCP-89 bacterium B3_LCP]